MTKQEFLNGCVFEVLPVTYGMVLRFTPEGWGYSSASRVFYGPWPYGFI